MGKNAREGVPRTIWFVMLMVSEEAERGFMVF